MSFSLVQILITLLFGGGSGGLMYWFLKKRDQDHNHEMDLSDRLENRLDKVEGDLDQTKQEVDRLKDRENELVFQINVLIKRIELLVGKLDGYGELTEDDKEKLTQIPEFKPSD